MQQSAKQDQTRAAGNWLAGEIDKMRNKVAEAEAKVEEYRVKSNLFVGSNNTSLPNQQLTEINSQIAAARGQKADLEARARQLRDLVRSGKPVESSDIANSESMRRLVEQRVALRAQLAEQSSTLLDQHPRIKELRAQIAEVDRQIKVEGERLARQLDNDAAVAGNRLESLTASLDQVKKLASQTNEQDVQLRALEREAKTQRDLLESYLAKYREASARDNINAAPPDARIISRATPAIKPAYPKKLPTVLIAAFAAFALSAGFTVTGALLGRRRRLPMPMATHPAGYAAPAYAPPAMSPGDGAADATRRVAAVGAGRRHRAAARARHAMAGQHGRADRRAACGRPARPAAASPWSAPCAMSAPPMPPSRWRARWRKTPMSCWSIWRSARPICRCISTDPKAPGIAELVRGTASFGDIITRDQYSRVHLVATGNVGNDGATLAASPMLATVIEALVRSYDHVVIDAGSAAGCGGGAVCAARQRAPCWWRPIRPIRRRGPRANG